MEETITATSIRISSYVAGCIPCDDLVAHATRLGTIMVAMLHTGQLRWTLTRSFVVTIIMIIAEWQ